MQQTSLLQEQVASTIKCHFSKSLKIYMLKTSLNCVSCIPWFVFVRHRAWKTVAPMADSFSSMKNKRQTTSFHSDRRAMKSFPKCRKKIVNNNNQKEQRASRFCCCPQTKTRPSWTMDQFQWHLKRLQLNDQHLFSKQPQSQSSSATAI